MVEFEFEGRPESQPRPASRWGSIRYNPKRQQLQDRRLELMSLTEPYRHGEQPFFDRNMWLIVEVDFFFPRPKIHMKKRGMLHYVKQQIRGAFSMAFVRRRVDIDNLSKFLLDVMNGVIYVDDVQVVRLISTKLNDDHGKSRGCTKVKVHRIWNPSQLGIPDGYYASTRL